MRKMFLFMMVTLDGYFEAPGHDISWHNVDDEFNDFVHGQNAGIDTIVMGKRTYELMADFWPKPEAFQMDGETAKFMCDTQKVIASDTAFTPAWGPTRVITQNVADEMRTLKSESGKEIAIFGSNMLATSLLEAGLIDELRIMVNPVVLGQGNALFAGLKKPLKLKLGRTRAFKSGNVLNYYAPQG